VPAPDRQVANMRDSRPIWRIGTGARQRWRLLLACALLVCAALVWTQIPAVAGKARPVQSVAPVASATPDESQRLLLLANQLKAEMGKATKDELSVQVVRKAEEIEKLARQMRTTR